MLSPNYPKGIEVAGQQVPHPMHDRPEIPVSGLASVEWHTPPTISPGSTDLDPGEPR